MTKLKVTVELNSACNLTITDVTGFRDPVTNVNGFLQEDNTEPLTLNGYKLSDGYFLNILLYNKYASAPIQANKNETFYSIMTENVILPYASNFVPSVYPLKQDGTYTIKRIFIPSLEFYNTNKTNPIYSTVDMYYSDGTSIFKVIDGVAAVETLTLFLTEDLLSSNVLSLSTSFISTCFTNTCYFKILSSLLDMGVGKCDRTNDYDKLIEKRDILYMTLETIKYLKEQNNVTQIQKLLEALDICGGICAITLRSISSTNCGCNG